MAIRPTYPPVSLLCLPQNSNTYSSKMWPGYHRIRAWLSDGLVLALWKPEDLTCDPKTLSLMERDSCRLSASMLPLSELTGPPREQSSACARASASLSRLLTLCGPLEETCVSKSETDKSQYLLEWPSNSQSMSSASNSLSAPASLPPETAVPSHALPAAPHHQHGSKEGTTFMGPCHSRASCLPDMGQHTGTIALSSPADRYIMCNMESHLLSLEYFFRRHQTPQELWRTVITTSTHWHFQFHTTNGERRAKGSEVGCGFQLPSSKLRRAEKREKMMRPL
ncbi:unnamed protein product [Leuciscus chuanchicus]